MLITTMNPKSIDMILSISLLPVVEEGWKSKVLMRREEEKRGEVRKGQKSRGKER